MFSEVEKFVTSNTQELAKDKWLCPLSGKKFKGPDYVKKHIFNKHGEKIEEVKKEVNIFIHLVPTPNRITRGNFSIFFCGKKNIDFLQNPNNYQILMKF